MKLRGLIEWINRLRTKRDLGLVDDLPVIRLPVRRLLFFCIVFLVCWPLLQFACGVSTGECLVYNLGYVLRGVVNG